MIKKWLISFICTCFLSFAGRSQINLVLNPSFEQYSNCPDLYDEAKYAIHWMSLDSSWSPPDWANDPPGVPDFCHVCASDPYVKVPFFGPIYPHTGNGMMQIQMFFDQVDTSVWTRDYLQGHLNHTLTFGHSYYVVLYTTNEQYSTYAINNIGAYFDDGSIDTTHFPGKPQTQYTPQVNDIELVFDSALTWYRVEGTFTANGTEKLITIGNFFDRAHTHYVPKYDTTGSGADGGYMIPYLFDDVSVIDCDNIPYAGHDTLIHSGDSAFIGPHEGLLPYTWYKMPSTTPIDSGGGIWVKPTTTTTYILEQKLCGTTKYDTIKVRVWPDTVTASPLLTTNNQLLLSPNPVKESLTIKGASGCELAVYDVLGRCVYTGTITTAEAVIDVATLLKGVYLVKITNTTTMEAVTLRLLKE